MEIKLTGQNWFSNGSVFVRGFCYDRANVLFEGEMLLVYFEKAKDKKTFLTLLESANGIFSVIVNYTSFKAFAIDGTRVYPLFYYFENRMIVSDSPDCLVNSNITIDELSRQEYLCSGAVFAGKTLLSKILQIKPFHLIEVHDSYLENLEYWSYCSKESETIDCSLDHLDRAFVASFNRMINSVRNRQIVVPLSGGLDSRLIVCMLKRFEITDVICYTYGRSVSSEYIIAKSVCEKLGFKHYLIDNSTDKYGSKTYFSSDCFKEYYNFIGSYGNYLWISEFIAIKWLKDNKLIAADAVFVPGHSADFIAGSHLTKALVSPSCSIRYLTNAIIYDSFEFSTNYSSVRDEVKSYFKEKQTEGMSAFSNYMSFISSNRLAHNINNSARIYEFFGHEVRLPFWDMELLILFNHLPYKRLYNCNLYVEYVTKCVFEDYGVNFPIKKMTRLNFIKQKIKNRLKAFLPKCFVHLFVSRHDDICEKELTEPMIEELNNVGIKKRFYLSYNEIMRDWYLYKVEQRFTQAKKKFRKNTELL